MAKFGDVQPELEHRDQPAKFLHTAPSFTVATMSEQYMQYEPQLRVVICRLCPEGVSKNGVALHYRRHHRDLPLRIRQELVEYANTFVRSETENIQYPSTIIARIEDLEVHEKGVRCYMTTVTRHPYEVLKCV
jgi:Orsellinic acid/F9775 biosynthesis cluster protein D